MGSVEPLLREAFREQASRAQRRRQRNQSLHFRRLPAECAGHALRRQERGPHLARWRAVYVRKRNRQSKQRSECQRNHLEFPGGQENRGRERRGTIAALSKWSWAGRGMTSASRMKAMNTPPAPGL